MQIYFTSRSLKKSVIFYIPFTERIFFSFLLVKEAVKIQLYESLYAFIIRFLFYPTVMTGAKLLCDQMNTTNLKKPNNNYVHYVTILLSFVKIK